MIPDKADKATAVDSLRLHQEVLVKTTAWP